jgi:hypothetical protein
MAVARLPHAWSAQAGEIGAQWAKLEDQPST